MASQCMRLTKGALAPMGAIISPLLGPAIVRWQSCRAELGKGLLAEARESLGIISGVALVAGGDPCRPWRVTLGLLTVSSTATGTGRPVAGPSSTSWTTSWQPPPGCRRPGQSPNLCSRLLLGAAQSIVSHRLACCGPRRPRALAVTPRGDGPEDAQRAVPATAEFGAVLDCPALPWRPVAQQHHHRHPCHRCQGSLRRRHSSCDHDAGGEI